MIVDYMKYETALAAWIMSEVVKASDSGRKMLVCVDKFDIYFLHHKGYCAYVASKDGCFIDYHNKWYFDFASEQLQKKLFSCSCIPDVGKPLQKSSEIRLRGTISHGGRRKETKDIAFLDKDGGKYYVDTDLLKPLEKYNACQRYIDTEYYLYNNLVYATNAGQIVAVFSSMILKEGGS